MLKLSYGFNNLNNMQSLENVRLSDVSIHARDAKLRLLLGEIFLFGTNGKHTLFPTLFQFFFRRNVVGTSVHLPHNVPIEGALFICLICTVILKEC